MKILHPKKPSLGEKSFYSIIYINYALHLETKASQPCICFSEERNGEVLL